MRKVAILLTIALTLTLSKAVLSAPAGTSGPLTLPKFLPGPVTADEMSFEEFVFVKRKPYSSDHYYTDIDNGTSPDRFLPANGIYIFNLRTRQERPVVTAAQMPGGKGLIGKISLSFDAGKILFDFRETADSGFRIWEVSTDGTGLRQVLQPPADEARKVARWGRPWHTDDIHPCYLPDGRIVFSSTRAEHTILCGGSAHLVAPCCTAWMPTAPTSSNSRKAPLASSARSSSTTAALCTTAGSTSTKAPVSARPSGP